MAEFTKTKLKNKVEILTVLAMHQALTDKYDFSEVFNLQRDNISERFLADSFNQTFLEIPIHLKTNNDYQALAKKVDSSISNGFRNL